MGIACRQAPVRRAGAVLAALTLLAAASIASPAAAQNAAGRRDSEIRIGNTMPYSGPASAYGIVGKTIAAYFNKINVEGGINGRRIRFISYDDSYNPAKTVRLHAGSSRRQGPRDVRRFHGRTRRFGLI